MNEQDCAKQQYQKFAAEIARTDSVNRRFVYGQSILHQVCSFDWGSEDWLGLAKILIQKGAFIDPVDTHGDTPLHYACRHENLKAVQFLVENRADVNVKNKSGDTSLHCAAARGNLEMVKWLVANGADINARGYGGNLPVCAAICADAGKLEVIKWLVENGSEDVEYLLFEVCDYVRLERTEESLDLLRCVVGLQNKKKEDYHE